MHVATPHRQRLFAKIAKVGVKRSSVIAASALGLTVLGAPVGIAASAQAHPSNFLHYQRGYYLDKYAGKTWLCYGWDNGAYHCTQHWHCDGKGHLISDNAHRVPNTGAATVATSTQVK